MPSLIAFALAMFLGPTGCGHSSSAGSNDEIPGLTSADRAARAAAMEELQRHWRKDSDGWTTAIVSGSPYAPDHFLRQCRALTIKEIEPQDLSESDKLNGFEWVGASELPAHLLSRGRRAARHGPRRHVQRCRQQTGWPMEPVGGLHSRAAPLRAAERTLAIQLGRHLPARNASRTTRFCKRGSAVGESSRRI